MNTVPAPSWSNWSTWSETRKAVAALFGAAVAGALVCAAAYGSGVLFLALNRADVRQARVFSTVQYWQLYASDPPLRRKLVIATATSGVAILVMLPLALVAASRKERPLHGDARFATPSEVARAGLIDTPTVRGTSSGSAGGLFSKPTTQRSTGATTTVFAKLLNRARSWVTTQASTEPASILIGRYRGKFLHLPGQLSVMLSAPTRSGKGVGVVIPNLLHWPDSVVVLDIKGENFDITAGFRAKHGQAVFAFSPFDGAGNSHRWNPLTAVRTGAIHRVGDLLAIGMVLFPNDGSGTSSEAFFNDQARNLFLGLGLYLLESPELPRTIGEMLRQASGQGQPLKDYLTAAINSRRAGNRALSFECEDALLRLLSTSENTLTSIVATFNAPLTIFADAIVDASTSGDDFDLTDLRRHPTSIYVRIPPNRLAPARPLLNLFYSQLVSLNTQTLPAKDPSLKLQCLLVNDEFAAMGRVGIIASAAPYLAGYNLRLLTVVQAMSQLDALYGDREARTFATNHGLQVLFAPREQRDADEYSAMLGYLTQTSTSKGRSRSHGQHGQSSISRNESDQRRALLLPQEVKELGSEWLVAIVENCKPILAEKIRYHRDKVFTSRLLPPPKVPQLDIEQHLARVQQRVKVLEDEIPEGTELKLETLAHDFSAVEVDLSLAHETTAEALLDFFGDKAAPEVECDSQDHPQGAERGDNHDEKDDVTRGDAINVIEPAPDEDGILVDSGPLAEIESNLPTTNGDAHESHACSASDRDAADVVHLPTPSAKRRRVRSSARKQPAGRRTADVPGDAAQHPDRGQRDSQAVGAADDGLGAR